MRKRDLCLPEETPAARGEKKKGKKICRVGIRKVHTIDYGARAACLLKKK